MILPPHGALVKTPTYIQVDSGRKGFAARPLLYVNAIPVGTPEAPLRLAHPFLFTALLISSAAAGATAPGARDCDAFASTRRFVIAVAGAFNVPSFMRKHRKFSNLVESVVEDDQGDGRISVLGSGNGGSHLGGDRYEVRRLRTYVFADDTILERVRRDDVGKSDTSVGVNRGIDLYLCGQRRGTITLSAPAFDQRTSPKHDRQTLTLREAGDGRTFTVTVGEYGLSLAERLYARHFVVNRDFIIRDEVGRRVAKFTLSLRDDKHEGLWVEEVLVDVIDPTVDARLMLLLVHEATTFKL